MRSRVDLRRLAEGMARAAVFAALAVALWRASRTDGGGTSTIAAASRMVDRAITSALSAPTVVALDISADAGMSHWQRDALAALRRAGVVVRWQGAQPPLAMEAVRDREPEARARLMVIGAATSAVVLADSASVIDTVRTADATVDVGTLVGAVRAALGSYAAQTQAPDVTPRRAVMVLGRASWESKFVMAALSEAGWTVRGRIPAAPNVAVSDEFLMPLDTARYDVVVMLDSSSADLAGGIARFVAQGGGLVAVGEASWVRVLSGLLPAQAGERRPGRILLADDTVTPPDLPVRPLRGLRRDALALDGERGRVTLAARRAGLGRVLSVGYDDSWRWRMLGGESGKAAHRAWWSRAVGAVAPERADAAMRPNDDAAPRAALINALGSDSRLGTKGVQASVEPTPLPLLVVLVLALLAEVASRRFRGAR